MPAPLISLVCVCVCVCVSICVSVCVCVSKCVFPSVCFSLGLPVCLWAYVFLCVCVDMGCACVGESMHAYIGHRQSKYGSGLSPLPLLHDVWPIKRIMFTGLYKSTRTGTYSLSYSHTNTHAHTHTHTHTHTISHLHILARHLYCTVYIFMNLIKSPLLSLIRVTLSLGHFYTCLAT